MSETRRWLDRAALNRIRAHASNLRYTAILNLLDDRDALASLLNEALEAMERAKPDESVIAEVRATARRIRTARGAPPAVKAATQVSQVLDRAEAPTNDSTQLSPEEEK